MGVPPRPGQKGFNSAIPGVNEDRMRLIGGPSAADDGYVSSDAPPASLQLNLGFKIPRESSSLCQEYVMMKG